MRPLPLVRRSGLLRGFGQQLERVNVDLGGDPLDALQRQIPLSSLDAAHVGPMDLKDIGEGLLAQSAGLSNRPQVPADGALQVSFGHRHTVPVCYLTVYRLISSVAALRSACRQAWSAARAAWIRTLPNRASALPFSTQTSGHHGTP